MGNKNFKALDRKYSDNYEKIVLSSINGNEEICLYRYKIPSGYKTNIKSIVEPYPYVLTSKLTYVGNVFITNEMSQIQSMIISSDEPEKFTLSREHLWFYEKIRQVDSLSFYTDKGVCVYPCILAKLNSCKLDIGWLIM